MIVTRQNGDVIKMTPKEYVKMIQLDGTIETIKQPFFIPLPKEEEKNYHIPENPYIYPTPVPFYITSSGSSSLNSPTHNNSYVSSDGSSLITASLETINEINIRRNNVRGAIGDVIDNG